MSTSVETWEHREIQANAVDVDSDGELLALAGKRIVAVLPTSAGGRVVGKTVRSSRWDVSLLRWAPKQKRLALASGRRVEVYVVSAGGDVRSELSWNGGPRSVTDVDWDPRDPNGLVSSSVDDSINVWDLRDLRRPSVALHVVSGANQGKWSPALPHILATAHDGDIKVWDVRKPSCPVQYLAGHLTKILGLDWSPVEEMCFASTSQDKTIKVWDFGLPNKPKEQSQLLSPAWKLRFSPLGNGWATIGLPKVGGHETGITLWRYHQSPDAGGGPGIRMCENLLGHSELVMDMAWAPLPPAGPLPSSLALFSVGRDQTLRKWLLSSSLLSMSSPVVLDEEGLDTGRTESSDEEEDPLPELHSFQRSGGPHVPDKVPVPKLTVGVLRPSRTFASASSSDRGADVGSPHAFALQASHRSSAPSIASPVYSLSAGYLDPRVPFPRSCGASFCSTGRLVYFGRVEMVWRGIWASRSSTDQRRTEGPRPTPRSLAEAMAAVQAEKSRTRTSSIAALKSFYYPELPAIDFATRRDAGKGPRLSDLHIYDATALLPISRELATQYELPLSESDVPRVCAHNAAAAAAVGRPDLEQLWELVGLCLESAGEQSSRMEEPWAAHPFGRGLISRLLDSAEAVGDVQTVAMVACVLGQRSLFSFPSALASHLSVSSNLQFFARRRKKLASIFGSAASPYATVHLAPEPSAAAAHANSNWLSNFIAASATTMQRPRSSSVDDGSPLVVSTAQLSPSKHPLSPDEPEDDQRLLSPSRAGRVEEAKERYASALYGWGLEPLSAAVLKYSLQPDPPSAGPEFVTLCRNCGAEGDRAQCAQCQRLAFQCCLCQISVRGLTWVCGTCGHGGHAAHMKSWFSQFDYCPANCGCLCLAAL